MAKNQVIEGPPAELRFRRSIRLSKSIRELWDAREVIWTIAERDLRTRYKQTVLGFAWAIITPVLLMLVFTLFLRRVATIDTGGAPYSLFAYIGLVPWTFFSNAVNTGGQSLAVNATLLNKVYCPREVFPMASVIVAAVDSAISVSVLGFLFIVTGFAPKITTLWVPVLLLIQLTFTLGVTITISGLVIYLRDLRHALPLALQLGLFATPVAWGIEQFIPDSSRVPYAALNPLAPVIDGYRRTVLFGDAPDWELVIPAAITSVLLLIGGYLIFKRLETGFTDVA